ncbi:hypothetical protein M378DRAFT_464360 [Amanita muscaria Koide BX008]|uniref:Uncharacterized protein n=1 Tax=Amanita muscaria (strain Koide BX008) TaxID=946122 RepID=A0A0C2TG07_AMAMK|nr:hypothetical protein M378DRAFT_464360 [Amanita muscaria Koide BX008]
MAMQQCKIRFLSNRLLSTLYDVSAMNKCVNASIPHIQYSFLLPTPVWYTEAAFHSPSTACTLYMSYTCIRCCCVFDRHIPDG